MGVTDNPETRKRINGVEFSVHYQVVVCWLHGLCSITQCNGACLQLKQKKWVDVAC